MPRHTTESSRVQDYQSLVRRGVTLMGLRFPAIPMSETLSSPFSSLPPCQQHVTLSPPDSGVSTQVTEYGCSSRRDSISLSKKYRACIAKAYAHTPEHEALTPNSENRSGSMGRGGRSRTVGTWNKAMNRSWFWPSEKGISMPMNCFGLRSSGSGCGKEGKEKPINYMDQKKKRI